MRSRHAAVIRYGIIFARLDKELDRAPAPSSERRRWPALFRKAYNITYFGRY